MSIIGDIFEELLSTTLYYKGIPVNIFGVPRFNHYKKSTVSMSLYRLNKKGYLKREGDAWLLTSEGERYAREKYFKFERFASPFAKGSKRDLLVMFDVPEERRNYREWLREQLKEFGYVMIQRSVWVGPSPLPKEFKHYLKKLNLDKSIKTFKLAKGYR